MALYTIAPLRHTLVVAGERPSFGGQVTRMTDIDDLVSLERGEVDRRIFSRG